MNKSIFIIQKKKAEKPETLKPKTKIEDPKNAIRNLATFFRLWGVVGYHTTTLVVEDSKIKIQDKSLWSKIRKRETIKKKKKSKQEQQTRSYEQQGKQKLMISWNEHGTHLPNGPPFFSHAQYYPKKLPLSPIFVP